MAVQLDEDETDGDINDDAQGTEASKKPPPPSSSPASVRRF
jgi:hypothetical protein